MLLDRQHPVVLDHLGTALARRSGVRMRRAVGIEVSFVRVEQRTRSAQLGSMIGTISAASSGVTR